jgi:Spy/CpxP family protein refolding chaperone
MLLKLILTGILAVVLGFGQRGGAGGGGMGGMGGGDEGGGNPGVGRGGMMSGGSSSRMDMWSNLLSLSKDQKKQIKGIMDEGQKEANPVRDQMLKARTAIAESVAAGKSQDDINHEAAALAAAEAQMHQIELSSFAKIYQALEKEQVAKVKPVFGMMAGVFMGKNWNEAH